MPHDLSSCVMMGHDGSRWVMMGQDEQGSCELEDIELRVRYRHVSEETQLSDIRLTPDRGTHPVQ